MSVALLQQAALDAKHARTVSRLGSTVARMESLVADLLDFARGRSGAGIPVHPRPVRLGALCGQALDELRLAHPDRELTASVEGDDGAVADPARVAQVVSNLVANALKHGAAGRPVDLRVSGAAERVRLIVRNEGPPIPPDLLPSVFEPFRAGDAPGSVGLGLFIVAEIARAHGGSASVRSDDAETVFSVDFPRSRAPAAEA
jgi:signal transduction histidine kinase